jgi:hypothetical protein
MTLWHSYPHAEPPGSTLLWVRRYPEGVAVNLATYDPQAITFTEHYRGWEITAALVYSTAAGPLEPNALPTPPALPALKYRDLVKYPPAQGDRCWIRRFHTGSTPCRATCELQPSGPVFHFVDLPGLAFPWWGVADWRPAG